MFGTSGCDIQKSAYWFLANTAGPGAPYCRVACSLIAGRAASLCDIARDDIRGLARFPVNAAEQADSTERWQLDACSTRASENWFLITYCGACAMKA